MSDDWTWKIPATLVCSYFPQLSPEHERGYDQSVWFSWTPYSPSLAIQSVFVVSVIFVVISANLIIFRGVKEHTVTSEMCKEYGVYHTALWSSSVKDV